MTLTPVRFSSSEKICNPVAQSQTAAQTAPQEPLNGMAPRRDEICPVCNTFFTYECKDGSRRHVAGCSKCRGKYLLWADSRCKKCGAGWDVFAYHTFKSLLCIDEEGWELVLARRNMARASRSDPTIDRNRADPRGTTSTHQRSTPYHAAFRDIHENKTAGARPEDGTAACGDDTETGRDDLP
ncbi:hypothetical protein BDW62DRAFT_198362 [Aspergillus aurantiobrunneus]